MELGGYLLKYPEGAKQCTPNSEVEGIHKSGGWVLVVSVLRNLSLPESLGCPLRAEERARPLGARAGCVLFKEEGEVRGVLFPVQRVKKTSFLGLHNPVPRNAHIIPKQVRLPVSRCHEGQLAVCACASLERLLFPAFSLARKLPLLPLLSFPTVQNRKLAGRG
jgi:hypothetical protein